MEWIPIVFVIFKVLVLGIGMFYAVKWHYDKGKKEGKEADVLRATGKIVVLFVLGLLVVGLFTYYLSQEVGLNLAS